LEELTLRDALVDDLTWTKERWADSLGVVLDDVGEGAREMTPDLVRWCLSKKDPVEAAKRLARLAVYTADDPVETLTTFVSAG
jgi:hypothetical protein